MNDSSGATNAAAKTAQDDRWTVLRLLKWTTEFFESRGSQSPRLDAEILLAHSLACSRIELYTAFESEPDEEQRTCFRELVQRRGEGAPVAQLVGYKEFYSLRFDVNEHTLIPRPETEHLVIAALDHLKQCDPQDHPPAIADIGTGSGAIAVSIAVHSPSSQLTAIDISPQALQVAASNAQLHCAEDRIEFVQSDLLADVDSERVFDLICSNPPYVSESEYQQLDPSVKGYEPKTALVSGPTGTEIIERILQLAENRLVPGGLMLIELSPMIAEQCLRLANALDHLVDAKLINDFSGLQRVLVAHRASPIH
ncbi:MAG: protein-(glutamine-N5) methyltransferase, release factor-specific [Geminicoccus sp.]|nr:protein-(glutamine-N5) methyltransferase, release factor-specific [Geminicoccus sp.]